MGTRCMTRLTNAFSKKWDNLQAAYYLLFAYYSVYRIHQTLWATPAMYDGFTNHVWELDELLVCRFAENSFRF
jgi:hypothetical protein